MQGKTEKQRSLQVWIDYPRNITVGTIFCATGRYSTSRGPYIECKIQGMTFQARLLDESHWDCTCSGLTGSASESLVAKIYDQQGGTLGDSDSASVTIDPEVTEDPCTN
jgi:hypothetical protein